MDNFFDKNIKLLKKRFPEIKTPSNCLSTDIVTLKSFSGELTAKYGPILLHSSYDPLKEASSLAKNISPKSFICIYGFGLGYHLQAMLDRLGSEGRLLVVELNNKILSAAMILRNQALLLQDNRFNLVTGDDEADVASTLSQHMRHAQDKPAGLKLEVIFHSASFKCIPEGFQKITNALEVLLLERRVPTIFGELEDQNFSFNREFVLKNPGLNSLQGKYRSRAAVMISAGPSLDDAIPFLKAIGKHALITCVDTVCPILLSHKIKPDFVFSLDPQECNFNFFRDHLDTSINLIYTPTTNAKTLHNVSGKKFVVFKDGNPLSRSNQTLLDKGITKAGGSVSCLGLDSLIQMGCNPIIMIGQDCAFTGGRNYSRLSQSEENLLLLIGSGYTLAKAHNDKTFSKKQVSVPCYFAGEIFTDQVLFSYLRNIEEIAKANPDIQIYNLFPHGAQIEQIIPISSINETLKILESD